MFENAKYRFNKDIDIKAFYQKALQGRESEDSFVMLTENFVSENESIIAFSQPTLIKHSANISYSSVLNTYYSNEMGYVCYLDDQLLLLPVININKDKTKCVAIIPLKDKMKKNLTQEQIEKSFHSLKLYEKVKPGLIKEVMNIYNQGKGGTITLLEGISAINKIPPLIELVYDIKTNIGQEDESGRINYKDKNYINNVRKGEIVAKYRFPKRPEIGKNIFGDIILPVEEKPSTYKIGEGLSADDEKGHIYSLRNGVLIISDDKTIAISDMKVIEGNVDITIGNLYVDGHLHVKGDISGGLEVKAKGSINIDGNIEESSVWSDKDLIVKGGIIGNEKSTINVGGNCRAGFIRNGHIKCENDVIVGVSVMHSNIISQGRVFVNNEKKGKIVGGKIYGLKGIDVSYVGGNNGIKTGLIVGVNAGHEEEIKVLNKRSQDIDKAILNYKNLLGGKYFRNPKDFLSQLPKHKVPLIKEIIEKLKNNLNEKINIEKKKQSLLVVKDNLKKASITVRKCCHEGVVIQINDAFKHFNIESTTPTKYTFNENAIEISPID